MPTVPRPAPAGARAAMGLLAGRYFVRDGGDERPPVPPGTHIIRVTVDPPYAPAADGRCPLVNDPATGTCHQLAASDYTNDVGRATVILPARPGRQGHGPIRKARTITADDEIDHEGR